MTFRKILFIVGILLSFIFVIRLVFFFITDHKDSIVYFVELLNWVSSAFIAFCLSYLYPQFKVRDERNQTIRQQAMYCSMFFVLASLVVIMLLSQFGVLALPTTSIVSGLISLTVVTMLLSCVILSKRM